MSGVVAGGWFIEDILRDPPRSRPVCVGSRRSRRCRADPGVFDRFLAPHELWVFADQFHQFRFAAGDGLYNIMLDWLVDRLQGNPLTHDGDVLYLEASGHGPNSPTAKVKRRWYEPDSQR